MSEIDPKMIDKIMEMKGDVREIKTNVVWLKESAKNTGRILELHDKRLSEVERDIVIIMERRTIFFKAVRYFLGIFGLKI